MARKAKEEPAPVIQTEKQRLQSAVAEAFKTRAGQDALKYLRLVFKEPALPADAAVGTLYFQNGARHVVAEIERLIAKGEGVDIDRYRASLIDRDDAERRSASGNGGAA